METMYNSMKGPSLFKRGSLNRFGVLKLINIYRVCIYKILFPNNIKSKRTLKSFIRSAIGRNVTVEIRFVAKFLFYIFLLKEQQL
jgi:hypothetical protein